MNAKRRSRAWACLLLAGLTIILTTSAGCNLLSVPFFLFGPEPKIEASLKRISKDKKEQTSRVVILVNNELSNASTDFVRADRDLGHLVSNALKEACKYNDEKIDIVPAAKVEEFKNRHDDWRTMPLEEIGRRFYADYVIDLELNKLTLFEYGSFNEIYRGRADITIALCDVNNPDEGALHEEFSWVYPKDSCQGVPVGDKTKAGFRSDFYRSLATQIAWRFTAHPTSQEFHQE